MYGMYSWYVWYVGMYVCSRCSETCCVHTDDAAGSALALLAPGCCVHTIAAGLALALLTPGAVGPVAFTLMTLLVVRLHCLLPVQ